MVTGEPSSLLEAAAGLSLWPTLLGNRTGYHVLSRCWRPLGAIGLLSITSAWLAGGCISRADAPFTRVTDREDAGGGSGNSLDLDGGTPDASVALPPTAPHAVLGVNPPHGSFAGGSRVIISGNGFSGTARVWFGDLELASSAIVPIDPQRIQVTVPAGQSGPVDVSVQNGKDKSTLASLSGGYTYDRFRADPASGPTSGGTRITVFGDSTLWDEKTTVLIDQNPCLVDEVVSKTELHCTTPPGTSGSKPMRVNTADGVAVDVLDAFVYGNSDNGFKGGLSGDPLDDNLKVIALDNISGLALEGATVIVGTDLDSADVLKTDSNGVAVDSKPNLSPETVTIARKCYQPQTFVDVPVDTVTAYLDPVLSPACGSAAGDLPPSGDSSVYAATVSGQVVWPATAEFRRDGWLDVPDPKSDNERLVAYVLRLSGSATDRFEPPDASEVVTPASSGDRGYGFKISVLPGNFTLYALAGIENTEQGTFTAYQMGLVRGVAAAAGETTSDVYIQIDVDLDHALTVELDPPSVTARGPDRVQAYASIQVGSEGYAPLPNGFLSRGLPLAGPLSFVGVPTLGGSLLGTNYVATARAVTGQAGSTPRSVVGLASATYTSVPLPLDPFVQVPVLTHPAPNTTWDGKGLASALGAGGAAADLLVYEVQSGGGLVGWTVIAPGTSDTLDLPNLNALSSDLGLVSGPLSITVNAARIKDFAYGTLSYRDTTSRGWAAYATDVFYASY